VAFIEFSKGKVINKTIGTPDRPVMRVPTMHLIISNTKKYPSTTFDSWSWIQSAYSWRALRC